VAALQGHRGIVDALAAAGRFVTPPDGLQGAGGGLFTPAGLAEARGEELALRTAPRPPSSKKKSRPKSAQRQPSAGSSGCARAPALELG
jgi:hypothetical protein